ncbi:MAG: hypothetical protein ACREJD_01230 [Phycisphaerales bacterium]
MRSLRKSILGDGRFSLGIAVGVVGTLAAASMFAAAPPPAVYVSDGQQVLFYTPRVVDPWKVIGVTSAAQDGKTYVYRLYENGAIDYLTPHEGPRSPLGVATWTPIPIDPKLCRVPTP